MSAAAAMAKARLLYGTRASAMALGRRVDGPRALMQPRRLMSKSETQEGPKAPNDALPDDRTMKAMMLEATNSQDFLLGLLSLKVVESEANQKTTATFVIGLTTVGIAVYLSQASDNNLLELRMSAQEEQQKKTRIEIEALKRKDSGTSEAREDADRRCRHRSHQLVGCSEELVLRGREGLMR